MAEKKEKRFVSDNAQLMAEWDYEKNLKSTPNSVSYGSGQSFWWKCKNGHTWKAAVYDRVNGNGCPYCSNNKVWTGYNDLATVYPNLLKEWDYDKNINIFPETIYAHSTKKVWWKCEKGHSWEAVVKERTNGTGCPYCANKKILQGYNDLATTHPHLLDEWDFEKNNNLTPYIISSGSSKKVWWKCEKGHSWEAHVHTRTKGIGCPVCSNKLLHRGYNDLETNNPSLAIEWDYAKNSPILPSEVLYGTNKKYWWKCKKGHSWSASVSSRQKGTGCPACSKEKRVSFPEKAIYFYVQKIFDNVQENVRLNEIKNKELDIFIPSIKLGIEYDGELYHKSEIKDLAKDKLCRENGISIIRVREPKCVELKSDSIIIDLKNRSIVELESAITKIFKILQSNFSISTKCIKIDIEADRIEIYKLIEMQEKENSIANKYPELLIDWHYEKNKEIKPQYINCGSSRKYWWKCHACGFEWMASASNRTKGTGCPQCYATREKNGRTAISGNSFADKSPELLAEWDYSKNARNPYSVNYGSSKEYWWKCKQGHSWKAIVSSRVRGNGCPVCSGQKVLRGYNDLKTKYPELSEEWDYAKNEEVPENLMPGSHKKVWWKCKKCGHSWNADIHSRVRGNGCPECGKIKCVISRSTPKTGTDLASKYPVLTKEWDYDKNGDLSPADVNCGSHRVVWWRGTCGHTWEAQIKHRVNGTGCPICSGRKVQIGFNDIATKSPRAAIRWDLKKNINIDMNEIPIGSHKKVWWVCPRCNYSYQREVYREIKFLCPNCKN